MKTQIKQLVNGSKVVVRDTTNDKYIGRIDCDRVIGSKHEERESIAAQVAAENPEGMDIIVKGIQLHLNKTTSTTGKSFWYSCPLTEDQYEQITGHHDIYKRFKCFNLMIDMMMEVTANTWHKKSENSLWREKPSIIIGEEFVEII